MSKWRYAVLEVVVKRIVIGIVFLLASVGGVTQAQLDQPIPCGGLDATDCKILRQNQDAMLDIESYDFTFTADMALTTGSAASLIPRSTTLRATVVATGAVTGDASMLSMPVDPALAADPAAYAEEMSRRYGAFDAELSLVIELPELLVEAMEGDFPATIPLDIVLADGILYIDTASLSETLNPEGLPLPSAWYGFSVSEFMSLGATATAPDASSESFDGMDPALQEALQDPEFLEAFYHVERLNDGTAADGAAVSMFHSSFNLYALMDYPAIEGFIIEQVAAQDEALARLEPDVLSSVISNALYNITISIDQTIGLDDHYTRTMNMTLDARLGGAMSYYSIVGGDNRFLFQDMDILMTIKATQSNFNSVAPIQAPRDATVIPLSSLLPLREQAKLAH